MTAKVLEFVPRSTPKERPEVTGEVVDICFADQVIEEFTPIDVSEFACLNLKVAFESAQRASKYINSEIVAEYLENVARVMRSQVKLKG